MRLGFRFKACMRGLPRRNQTKNISFANEPLFRFKRKNVYARQLSRWSVRISRRNISVTAKQQGDELMEVVGIFIIFAIGIAIELIKIYKEKHDQDLRDRINKKGRQ